MQYDPPDEPKVITSPNPHSDIFKIIVVLHSIHLC